MKNLIVGLVVAIVAGIVILAVEYNYFNPRPSTQHTVDTAASKSTHKSSLDKPSSNDGLHTASKPSKSPQMSTSQEKLRKMYAAAKEISFDTSARNKALRDVVNEAIRYKDYNFAAKVAQDISYDTSERNNALEEIIKYACASEDFDTANRVADLITYDSTKKNANKQRILDAIKQSLK